MILFICEGLAPNVLFSELKQFIDEVSQRTNLNVPLSIDRSLLIVTSTECSSLLRFFITIYYIIPYYNTFNTFEIPVKLLRFLFLFY